jgi:hypothetical protein
MSKIILFYSNFSVHCKNLISKIDNIVDLDIEKICIDNIKIRKLLSKTSIKLVPHLILLEKDKINEEISGAAVNTWIDSLLEDVQSKKREAQQKFENDMREREMREREMREREMREREMRERPRQIGERAVIEDGDFNSLDSLGIESRRPKVRENNEFEPKGNDFKEDVNYVQQKIERHQKQEIQKAPEMKKIKEDDSGTINISDMAKNMEKSRNASLEKLKV